MDSVSPEIQHKNQNFPNFNLKGILATSYSLSQARAQNG